MIDIKNDMQEREEVNKKIRRSREMDMNEIEYEE